jgi:hypothetical protein
MKIKKIVVLAIAIFIPWLHGCVCIGYKTDCSQMLKEKHTMSDTVIMDFGDYDVMLPPLTYCAGDEIRYVFAVPKNNMVGTNELDNAIKLLEFKSDNDLEQHVIKKNFLEMVTGPFEFRFLPVWSDKEIAYSQSKGFIIVNIQDRTVEIHTISPGIYTGDIEKLAVLDASSRTFVLEINPHAAGMGNYEKILKVIRFNNGAFTILSEYFAGIKTPAYTPPWFVYQKNIFVYNDSTTKLEVFDKEFKPVSHPLAEAFNQNSDKFRQLFEIVIHPDLPIAIIVETGKNVDWKYLESLPVEVFEKVSPPLLEESARRVLYLFQWEREDKNKRFVPLISPIGSNWKSYNPVNSYDNFCFSPDGKWVVFQDHSNDSKNPTFVAIPISDKNPLYLGKPVKLGKVIREDAIGPTGTAWTTNPTAFVMCDGMLIYRWNLDKYFQQSVTRVKMPPGSPDPFVK